MIHQHMHVAFDPKMEEWQAVNIGVISPGLEFRNLGLFTAAISLGLQCLFKDSGLLNCFSELYPNLSPIKLSVRQLCQNVLSLVQKANKLLSLIMASTFYLCPLFSSLLLEVLSILHWFPLRFRAVEGEKGDRERM
jgi:hypothetical protein